MPDERLSFEASPWVESEARLREVGAAIEARRFRLRSDADGCSDERRPASDVDEVEGVADEVLRRLVVFLRALGSSTTMIELSSRFSWVGGDDFGGSKMLSPSTLFST
jgi:hypothetical protein